MAGQQYMKGNEHKGDLYQDQDAQFKLYPADSGSQAQGIEKGVDRFDGGSKSGGFSMGRQALDLNDQNDNHTGERIGNPSKISLRLHKMQMEQRQRLSYDYPFLM